MEHKRKLLIIGDSFAASTHASSWVTGLGNFDVDNLASNGASEYRLIKQIPASIHQYANVIFVHTSPNRLYVENNPYHVNSATHAKCDLIYSDIHSRLPDEYAGHVTWFFENLFDIKQAEFVHELQVKYAQSQLPNAVHITFFEYMIPGVINLHHVWKQHPGDINHMNAAGNAAVRKLIKRRLQ